jgi:branched-chain amino acid transport system substrate-binding protein
MYCAEVQGCRAAASKAAFEKVGLQVVYEAQVSIAAPDYTAQCLGARNAGAEGVFVSVDTQSIGRLANNCASVGFKPTFGWPAQVTSDTQLSRPELDGAIVSNAVAPWFLDTLPAVAEFRAAMTRFAPSVPIDGSAIQGWTSGKLLERAGRSLAAATSAEILKGLWSLSGDDLGGLTYPLTFKETDPNNGVNMRMCFFDVRIQSGRWASPDGGQRHCSQ